MVMNLLDAAIYGALNVATLTDVIGTGKIFADLAPEGTARPYVVFNVAGGGLQNETRRKSLDATYTIKCVSKTGAQVTQVADIIEGILAESTIAITGWYDIRIQQSGFFRYYETIDSQQIWYAGANYRLRSAKTTV